MQFIVFNLYKTLEKYIVLCNNKIQTITYENNINYNKGGKITKDEVQKE